MCVHLFRVSEHVSELHIELSELRQLRHVSECVVEATGHIRP